MKNGPKQRKITVNFTINRCQKPVLIDLSTGFYLLNTKNPENLGEILQKFRKKTEKKVRYADSILVIEIKTKYNIKCLKVYIFINFMCFL